MTQKKLRELFQRNSTVEMLDAGDGTYQGKYLMDFQQFEEAAAEIRRQALEEVAAQIHARLYDHAQDPEIEDSITAQARFLEAEAIQEMVHEMIDESALAQSDQEKS